jgi:hypothetical protein
MKVESITAATHSKFTKPTGIAHNEMENASDSSSLREQIVDPLCDSDWDRLVLSHPDFNFFHSTAWARVVCQSYGHTPIYLHFSRGNRSVALIPLIDVRSRFTGRRGVCLPFSDCCAPLIFDHFSSTAIAARLAQLAVERKWKYFELRESSSLTISTVPSSKFYGHELDLRGRVEDLPLRFSSPVRRALRKAEKSRLSVETKTSRAAMIAFYRLHVQTRRRHGVPPQPLAFFLSIHENIIEPGLGFVVLAKSGTRTVAAAIFFRFGKKALYKFGASDRRYQDLRSNNLVMWEAIKSLAQNGSEIMHFGRTAVENEGLRRFKLSWGAQERIIKYFRFDPLSAEWTGLHENRAGFYNKIFSHMPLAINRLAGAAIYPHLD